MKRLPENRWLDRIPIQGVFQKSQLPKCLRHELLASHGYDVRIACGGTPDEFESTHARPEVEGPLARLSIEEEVGKMV